ncbi:hypothetical protein WR25_06127 [Diploscapter pachys]|uniref:UBX domain-containing protein 4 n=1 Tax=Diploscapter pachys TaxID=2018661 RepID=A0A2A2LDG5_9BILA|nr:hypothetical protein WR25_06127 [Diploscapter pachys]
MAPILWFEGRLDMAARVAQHNKGLLFVVLEREGMETSAGLRRLWEQFDATLLSRPYVAVRVNDLQLVRSALGHIHSPEDVSPSVSLTMVYDCSPPFSFDSLQWSSDLNYDKFHNFILNSAQKSPAQSASLSQPASTSTQENAADQSVEEKVKKARQLLENKRKIDDENKRKEEKEKELERIKNAKAMQQTQKEKDEKALIEAAAQRRKDKVEAEKEKERVKALLQADKEEREYRQKMMMGMNAGNTQNEKKENIQLNKPIPSDRCRVLVRFPDGSCLVEEFPSSDNLHSLIELILQKKLATPGFKLSQFYPRRVFSEEEKGRTYLDLGLTPTCTLIVLQDRPNSDIKPLYDGANGFWILLAALFSPLQFIWTKLAEMVGFGGSNTARGNDGTNRANRAENDGTPAQGQGQEPHRRGIPTGAAIRRRGNIARLHNANGEEQEPDEDMANYNGNSTQFF